MRRLTIAGKFQTLPFLNKDIYDALIKCEVNKATIVSCYFFKPGAIPGFIVDPEG